MLSKIEINSVIDKIICRCMRQEFLFRYENVKITDISPGLVEGQDTDILDENEICREKLPALAPKDVSAAVIYAISVKENVQVINLSSSKDAWKLINFSSFFITRHFRFRKLKLRYGKNPRSHSERL
jgi:hypothetical protein